MPTLKNQYYTHFLMAGLPISGDFFSLLMKARAWV